MKMDPDAFRPAKGPADDAHLMRPVGSARRAPLWWHFLRFSCRNAGMKSPH